MARVLPDQLTPCDQSAGADSDADPERRPDRVRVSSATDDPAATGKFGACYSMDRYLGGQGTSRHDPSPSLVAEVADLPPGRALDAGGASTCGPSGSTPT